ncbi:MAG: hypothetical protein PHC61_05455 [Chitinivibrionales bacterium]|nr:hypothetical protein [Chitinivibrionales bacterium]
MQAFVFVTVPSAAQLGSDALKSPANIWYTQIGQWHLQHKDSARGLQTAPAGKSFLFHDARIDGARSGQATAKVRLNFVFQDIRRFEARLALGLAPTTAGLLVQNKQITFCFFAERGDLTDSLRIVRFDSGRGASLAAVAAKVLDTTRLRLFLRGDTLYFSADKTAIFIAKPPEFLSLTSIGFECLRGSVKVFDTFVQAQNAEVKESFDRATLVNLHLEKMFSGSSRKGK